MGRSHGNPVEVNIQFWQSCVIVNSKELKETNRKLLIVVIYPVSMQE